MQAAHPAKLGMQGQSFQEADVSKAKSPKQRSQQTSQGPLRGSIVGMCKGADPDKDKLDVIAM